MKKYLRIASILFVLAACMVLSGCSLIDEMRASHGFWDNGNIKLGDDEYILMSENDSLLNDYLYDEFEDPIYITECDVPVLLSVFCGDDFRLSGDGIFLRRYYYSESDTVYCRKDKYDDIVKRIDEGNFFDGMCYFYYDDSYEYVYRFLTNSEIETIENVLATEEPLNLPENAEFPYDYMIYIYRCSEDLVFSEDAYELFVSDGTYYITAQDDGDFPIYRVPHEYNDVFEEIMSDYVNSDQYIYW